MKDVGSFFLRKKKVSSYMMRLVTVSEERPAKKQLIVSTCSKLGTVSKLGLSVVNSDAVSDELLAGKQSIYSSN